MIEWKGLYANTPYSSANNKTQDDAVVGMQDTIYVTGPGYGGYSANVRVHNASGAVVALIPVSGGGGALSAPAPVRILDDSTTYSYSLEVVRGVVPSDDADKIVIRIIGGSAKRFPVALTQTPSGAFSLAGPLLAPGLRHDLPVLRRKFADVASGAGECVIGVIGDSHNLAVGGGSGGTYLLNDAARFAPAFIAGRKVAGKYGVPVSDDGWWGWRGMSGLVTLNAFDPRWVLTGTWGNTSSSNESLGYGALRATADGSTATYTATRNWNVAEIWMQQNTGATGAAVASATGASDVTLTLLGAAPTLQKFTLTKSAVDANPLVITAATAFSNYVGIAAINFIDTTKPAIRIQNHAMSGRTMSDHIIATKPYSSFSAYQTAGLSADVLLVEVLHNSIKGAAQTKAAWLASWETFLAAMDTAARDIIVYIGYPGNYDWATNGTMDDWIGSLYPLLEARQINMIDLREIFTASWTTGEAQDLMYDNDHPNKRGLALYGAKMAKDLLWATDYFV